MASRCTLRRGLRLTTCLLPVVLLSVGCAGQPHPTLGELEKLPAASIVYPGSIGPGARGHDSDNKFGPNPAVFVRVELTNATPSQLLNYYQQQLLADGWTRSDSAAGGNLNWTASWGWRKGKRSIALGIINDEYKARLQQASTQYGSYSDGYEIDLT